MSSIDPLTVQDYLETDYIVRTEPAIILQVEFACEALLQLHLVHKVQCSAVITACNPYSAMLDDEANVERQVIFSKEIERRGLTAIPAVGQHPSNGWPAEDSFLVFGLDLEAAKSLGMRFQQNGIIWSGADAVPKLILLR